MTHYFGWKPPYYDQRDLFFSSSPLGQIPIVEKTNLKNLCGPIEDQGPLGCCVWHAMTSAIEFLELKNGVVLTHASRLFGYYNTRVIENTVDYDSGCSIRNAIKAVNRYGVCREEVWPYEVYRFREKPGMGCYHEAKPNSITSYLRMITLNDILRCLSMGYPVILGMLVYPSMMYGETTTTGVVMPPERGEAPEGGHAILIVGHDLETKTLMFKNSWGTIWGDRGYGTLPFEYMEFCDDMWVIKR